jgi:tripartite-type tricarboxylate transporter receptor subunit TctC
LPDVPTLAELGYHGDLTRLYFGIVAPVGTPQPIIQKLYEEFATVGKDAEFRQKHMIDVGLEPVFSTPEEFASFLNEDRAASARIVKESGMEPQ